MFTTTASGRAWTYSHTLGAFATSGKGFLHPTDLAISSDGILYVVSRGQFATMDTQISKNRLRITKLTIDEEFLGEFGTGDFTWPAGLAVDHDDNLYCSDEFDNTVYVYNSDGEKINQWGQKGSGIGEFIGPAGIIFDNQNHINIVDTFNNRIQKYTCEGDYIDSWGMSGDGPGQFDKPWGITIDNNGNIYVADWGNNRVQKFTSDGTYLMSFGENSRGGGLLRPADVAIDSHDDVYVTDWGNKRVQIFASDGSPLTALYGDAMEFSKWANIILDANEDVRKAFNRVEDLTPVKKFDRPRGITIDGDDRIIIVDSTRCRLQVYQREISYTEPQFNL